ncbi:MAG TPA: AAA family ATPase [Candidatus Scybalocola faecipullorum]|nr:AAA family ATPase [Candidatus Scybalocola faecipullorum]
MTQRICFMGRGGVGKTILVSNISAALAAKGFHVLQIGNDISLNSTELLRESKQITPVLDEFRLKYDIRVEDYLVETPSGVYCLELGSIDPGAGCLARGLSIVDEMMDSQKMLEKYHIDVVIYDIAGDTPCTGYILPVREGIMDKVILVTNDRYASVSTVNCLLSAVLRQGEGHPLVYLLENHTDCMSESELLDAYAAETHMTVLGCIEYNEVTEHAALMDETVVCEYPESGQAKIFRELAQKIVDVNTCSEPEPFSRTELLEWQQQWKMKRLEKLKRMK